MKKFCFAFVLFFAFAVQIMAQGDVSPARWNTSAMITDGKSQDWPGSLNFFDTASGLKYAISNDKQNLYLIFSVNDPMKMMKVMRSGWSIELSSKEKKRKFSATLGFPGVQTAGQGFQRSGNEKENRAEGYLMINEYGAQVREVALHGFLSGQTELRLNSRKGIQVGIGSGSNHDLIYEIAIPMKELMPENLVRLNEMITLTVNVNPIARPSGAGGGGRPEGGMSQGGGRGGGGMQGGGGRMGGGMSGGGMRGGGMSEGDRQGGSGAGGDRSAMFEKASFKQKFVLVSN